MPQLVLIILGLDITINFTFTYFLIELDISKIYFEDIGQYQKHIPTETLTLSVCNVFLHNKNNELFYSH